MFPTSYYIVLFATPKPYSNEVYQLLNGIATILNDMIIASSRVTTMFTQLWRSVYLVHRIIDKTPTTIQFFISTLLVCFNELLGIYNQFVSDPSLSKYLTLQKKEPSKTYVCLLLFILDKLISNCGISQLFLNCMNPNSFLL